MIKSQKIIRRVILSFLLTASGFEIFSEDVDLEFIRDINDNPSLILNKDPELCTDLLENDLSVDAALFSSNFETIEAEKTDSVIDHDSEVNKIGAMAPIELNNFFRNTKKTIQEHKKCLPIGIFGLGLALAGSLLLVKGINRVRLNSTSFAKNWERFMAQRFHVYFGPYSAQQKYYSTDPNFLPHLFADFFEIIRNSTKDIDLFKYEDPQKTRFLIIAIKEQLSKTIRKGKYKKVFILGPKFFVDGDRLCNLINAIKMILPDQDNKEIILGLRSSDQPYRIKEKLSKSTEYIFNRTWNASKSLQFFDEQKVLVDFYYNYCVDYMRGYLVDPEANNFFLSLKDANNAWCNDNDFYSFFMHHNTRQTLLSKALKKQTLKEDCSSEKLAAFKKAKSIGEKVYEKFNGSVSELDAADFLYLQVYLGSLRLGNIKKKTRP